MGLLSILHRKKQPGALVDDASLTSPDAIRVHVRRRFIGAALLALVAVVVLPLVFETKPRPLPIDVAIEVPKRDAVPPLTMPPARAGSAATNPALPGAAVLAKAEPTPAPVAQPSPASQSAPVSDADPAAPAPASAARPVAKDRAGSPDHHATPGKPVVEADKPEKTKPAAKAEAVKPAAKPEAAKPAPAKPADGARAQAMLDGRDTKAAEGSTRFVVQVGAFEQASAVREARQRVEKLGLKTFQQDVKTSQGKRIRVRLGPFRSREEAEKAMAKLGANGIAASVVPL